jgi:hypothetical protein
MILKAIKLVLSILLFLCLLKLPYGYYEFVRFAALVGFIYLAYQEKESGKYAMLFIYSALAFLFQPFFKIALGRHIWNIVDVVVGVGLITSIFFSDNSRQPK